MDTTVEHVRAQVLRGAFPRAVTVIDRTACRDPGRRSPGLNTRSAQRAVHQSDWRRGFGRAGLQRILEMGGREPASSAKASDGAFPCLRPRLAIEKLSSVHGGGKRCTDKTRYPDDR